MSSPSHDRVESFPPIEGAGARVLVLGSIPSVASLQKGEYYGHPRNAFWPLMGALFSVDASAPYPLRCEQLRRAGVAVWDVLQACVRPGSLDSAIRRDSERVNDLDGFLERQPDIAAVFLNGRKAEEAWVRHVERPRRAAQACSLSELPPTTLLPSSSPAMASLDFAGKLERWRAVAEAVARAT